MEAYNNGDAAKQKVLEALGQLRVALKEMQKGVELLEQEVAIAELCGRKARFEILLLWRDQEGGAASCWHMSPGGLRWSGTFAEASEIVRSQYAPVHGQQPHIVVQVDG